MRDAYSSLFMSSGRELVGAWAGRALPFFQGLARGVDGSLPRRPQPVINLAIASGSVALLVSKIKNFDEGAFG